MLGLKEKFDILSLGREVLDIECEEILRLKSRLGRDFEQALEIIYNCEGTVIVTGMGKSGHIGRKIAATLCSTGTPSYFLHPAESTHGDSGIITKRDVVIAISNSGETEELLNLLPLIKRFNIPLIAITGKNVSTLSKQSDVTLDINVKREACPLNKAPTASTTVTLALGDAIAICLLKMKNFTKDDFLIFHPSGALGKTSLYKVKDLMIKEENLPIVNEKLSFLEAVKYVSEKRLGSTLIADDNKRLIAILTDGDIRRALLSKKDLEELGVKEVATKRPKTIDKNDLAAKALSIMEKYSITSLAVVDENNIPIGLIHIQDLLKAGVV